MKVCEDKKEIAGLKWTLLNTEFYQTLEILPISNDTEAEFVDFYTSNRISAAYLTLDTINDAFRREFYFDDGTNVKNKWSLDENDYTWKA